MITVAQEPFCHAFNGAFRFPQHTNLDLGIGLIVQRLNRSPDAAKAENLPHNGIGAGNFRFEPPGALMHFADKGRTGAIDHGIGHRRCDDFPPQAMVLNRIRIVFLQRCREITEQIRLQHWVVRQIGI